MRIYLIHRGDILLFCEGRRMDIFVDRGREYIETHGQQGEEMTVHMIRLPEFSLSGYGFYAAVFWWMGFFGLLTHYRFPACCLRGTLHYKEDRNATMQLRFAPMPHRGKDPVAAAELLNAAPSAFLENAWYILDARALRRWRRYRFFSFLARAALIVTVIFVLL